MANNQVTASEAKMAETNTPIASFTPTLTPTPIPVSPTQTLEPSPEPTATPIDNFSDLIPCASIPQALTADCFVTRQDIVSGRLLRMAKSIATPFDTPFSKDIQEYNASIPRASNSLAYKNLLIFRYIDGDYQSNNIVIIQQWKNKNGSYGYLQYVDQFSDCDGRCPTNNKTLDILRKKNILPEFYWSCNSDFRNISWEEIRLEDDLMQKYSSEIECIREKLINQWRDTGNIPEELSNYPLKIYMQW